MGCESSISLIYRGSASPKTLRLSDDFKTRKGVCSEDGMRQVRDHIYSPP